MGTLNRELKTRRRAGILVLPNFVTGRRNRTKRRTYIGTYTYTEKGNRKKEPEKDRNRRNFISHARDVQTTPEAIGSQLGASVGNKGAFRRNNTSTSTARRIRGKFANVVRNAIGGRRSKNVSVRERRSSVNSRPRIQIAHPLELFCRFIDSHRVVSLALY